MLDELGVDKEKFANGDVTSITERTIEAIHVPTDEVTIFKPYQTNLPEAGDEVVSWLERLKEAADKTRDDNSRSIS